MVGMAIKLYRGLYIADPWPAAYIEDMDALVFSDLHLGIEGTLEEEGVFLPRGVSRATADIVFSAIEDYRPSTVVFDGDLKHSFGLLKTSEWRELRSFFERLRDVYRLQVYVVRGNHDNYLGVLLDRFGYKFFERLDGEWYTIIHGHEDVDPDELREVVILGHEHPSIVLRDEAGGKYRFKCFLWGDYGEKKFLVLPPVSELSGGSNYASYELMRPMSPILRRFDMGVMRPYAIVVGEAVMELPPLRELGSVMG